MALALDDTTPHRQSRAPRRPQADREADAPTDGARPVGIRRVDGDPREARAIALRRIVAEVNGTLELDAVLEDVLDSSQELFGADAAGIWQLQPRRQPFESSPAGPSTAT